MGGLRWRWRGFHSGAARLSFILINIMENTVLTNAVARGAAALLLYLSKLSTV
jgi:hypothetical protein